MAANDSNHVLVDWIALTIDCADVKALAEFYVAGLGAEIRHRSDDVTFLELQGLPINLREVGAYRPPTWPSSDVPMHTHFEIVVHDPDNAAARLHQFGARLADYQDPQDSNLIVMLDPAGHPFCLIRSSQARRF
jgi:hypothetical protein